mmetsp:Transcript_6391/g.25814  ORF Transcript_6391/g.25814 Transcript_6391/m.25814 type:complete len:252 (-) Transcript_6391:323-1078(-)
MLRHLAFLAFHVVGHAFEAAQLFERRVRIPAVVHVRVSLPLDEELGLLPIARWPEVVELRVRRPVVDILARGLLELNVLPFLHAGPVRDHQFHRIALLLRRGVLVARLLPLTKLRLLLAVHEVCVGVCVLVVHALGCLPSAPREACPLAHWYIRCVPAVVPPGAPAGARPTPPCKPRGLALGALRLARRLAFRAAFLLLALLAFALALLLRLARASGTPLRRVDLARATRPRRAAPSPQGLLLRLQRQRQR